MSKISDAFVNGKAFIPFITCGDPDLQTTAQIVKAAADNGADIIELGIPFSDPTAEGPVIQEANVRALKNEVTTDDVFKTVEQIRTEVSIPLVFMTYANVVFSYGCDAFFERCAQVGISGIVLADVPFEEMGEFEQSALKHNVEMISLVSPTSEDRIAKIVKHARGFVYIVSSLGVTGVRDHISTDIGSIVKVVRANTNIPCAVGFGISTPEQARNMASLADGAIVGSAIVKIIAAYGKEAPSHVGAYVRSMKDAIKDL